MQKKHTFSLKNRASACVCEIFFVTLHPNHQFISPIGAIDSPIHQAPQGQLNSEALNLKTIFF